MLGQGLDSLALQGLSLSLIGLALNSCLACGQGADQIGARKGGEFNHSDKHADQGQNATRPQTNQGHEQFANQRARLLHLIAQALHRIEQIHGRRQNKGCNQKDNGRDHQIAPEVPAKGNNMLPPEGTNIPLQNVEAGK